MSTDKMRAEFESMMRSREDGFGKPNFFRGPDESYVSYTTQVMWEAWQEALSARGEGEPVAWLTEDGERCVTEKTMSGAQKDGGAMLSSLSAYTVPAFSAQPAPVATLQECHWSPDSDMDNMPGTWEGSCGIVWSFIEGGPAENEVWFCPKCGEGVVLGAQGVNS